MLDIFYNADVVVVDMTITVQQSSLFYHIGVRESMGMKCNVVIVNDTDPEVTVSLRVSCCHGYCCECCDTDLEVTVTQGRLLPWKLL